MTLPDAGIASYLGNGGQRVLVRHVRSMDFSKTSKSPSKLTQKRRNKYKQTETKTKKGGNDDTKNSHAYPNMASRKSHKVWLCLLQYPMKTLLTPPSPPPPSSPPFPGLNRVKGLLLQLGIEYVLNTSQSFRKCSYSDLLFLRRGACIAPRYLTKKAILDGEREKEINGMFSYDIPTFKNYNF